MGLRKFWPDLQTSVKILFGVILHLGVSNLLLSLGLKFWNPGLTMSRIYHSTPPDFVQ